MGTRQQLSAALLLMVCAIGCGGGGTLAPADGDAPVSADLRPVEACDEHAVGVLIGKLVQLDDGTLVDHAVVVARDGRITYVGVDEAQIPCGATRVDWSAYTVIPGLVDAHTHFSIQTDDAPGTKPWQRASSLDAGTRRGLMRHAAEATLKCGVTTAIDKGSGGLAALVAALRDDIAAGTVPGPRIFTAGYGVSGLPSTPLPTLRAWIEDDIASGADLIKVWADGCTGDKLSCDSNFSTEQIKAAVMSAHSHGKPLALHAYHEDVAKRAIIAGVDSLEHPDSFDSEDLVGMVNKHITYVPTVDHNRYYRDNIGYFGYDPSLVDAYNAFIQLNVNAVAAAHQAGVKIAMGSDAVFTGFGQNTRELDWLVMAGMSPLEALRAATINGAASIGVDKQIGRIAVGYYADLVALDGNPLLDIRVVIDRVRAVMKSGAVVAP